LNLYFLSSFVGCQCPFLYLTSKIKVQQQCSWIFWGAHYSRSKDYSFNLTKFSTLSSNLHNCWQFCFDWSANPLWFSLYSAIKWSKNGFTSIFILCLSKAITFFSCFTSLFIWCLLLASKSILRVDQWCALIFQWPFFSIMT